MRNIGENLSEDDLNEMISEADRNGDGLIDYQEFVGMLSKKWLNELAAFQTDKTVIWHKHGDSVTLAIFSKWWFFIFVVHVAVDLQIRKKN